MKVGAREKERKSPSMITHRPDQSIGKDAALPEGWGIEHQHAGEDIYPPIRVLLVESSDAECIFLKNKLEQEGNIKVIGMARDQHEARNMVKALTPDIIIMDITEPDSGGIGFLQRLQHFCPTPVLIVSPTSKMPFPLVLSAFQAGVIDIIDKDNLDLIANGSSLDLILSKIRSIAYLLLSKGNDNSIFH